MVLLPGQVWRSAGVNTMLVRADLGRWSLSCVGACTTLRLGAHVGCVGLPAAPRGARRPRSAGFKWSFNLSLLRLHVRLQMGLYLSLSRLQMGLIFYSSRLFSEEAFFFPLHFYISKPTHTHTHTHTHAYIHVYISLTCICINFEMLSYVDII